jgi:uncharacterized protein
VNTVNERTRSRSESPPRGEDPARIPRTTGAVRSWVTRHPVAAFLAVAVAIAYPVMSVPIMASHGVIPDGWLPQAQGLDTERIASVLLVFVALLPAAMWVTWAAEGRPGVARLVNRMFRWRIGATWTVLVLAALPSVTLALAMLFGDTPRTVDIVPLVTGQVIGLLVNLVLINMWEETAWSGVVQTRLERRHGLVKAALLTAVPFALAHMPLHFIGNFSAGSLITALVTLLIVSALVRLMIGVFLRGTRESILAVALLHTVFNRTNNDEGVVAALVEGDGRKIASLVAVVLLTAAAALVARQRMGRTQRLILDARTSTSSRSLLVHDKATA